MGKWGEKIKREQVHQCTQQTSFTMERSMFLSDWKVFFSFSKAAVFYFLFQNLTFAL